MLFLVEKHWSLLSTQHRARHTIGLDYYLWNESLFPAQKLFC